MPYALFTNDEQISKAYGTRQEVWQKADEAGLVVDALSDEGHDEKPQRVLDADYSIKPCPPDPEASLQPDQFPPKGIRKPERLRRD